LIDNLYNLVDNQYEKESQNLIKANTKDKKAIMVALNNEFLAN